MILRIIDKQTNLFIRDDFTYDEELEFGLDTEPSQGLYKPKWDGDKWVEGATQAEIDEITKMEPQEPTELELLMLAISDLDAQRELDRTDNQVAIAELAELMIGGF